MTENEIKKFGYQFAYAPDSETPERERFEERLRLAVVRINTLVPFGVQVEAIRQFQRLNSPELIANNEASRLLLTADTKISYQAPGLARGRLAINPEKSYYISGFIRAI